MCTIAGEYDPPVDETSHSTTLKCVYTVPFFFELYIIADHSPYKRLYIFGFDAFCSINIPSQLEIEPPDIIRLLVE